MQKYTITTLLLTLLLLFTCKAIVNNNDSNDDITKPETNPSNEDTSNRYYLYTDSAGNTVQTALAYFSSWENTITVAEEASGGASSTSKYRVLTGAGGGYAAGGWQNLITPVDVSAYNTLVFWAKSPTATAIHFNVVDSSGTKSVKNTIITTEWIKYTIPFSVLGTNGINLKELKYGLSNTNDVVHIDEVYLAKITPANTIPPTAISTTGEAGTAIVQVTFSENIRFGYNGNASGAGMAAFTGTQAAQHENHAVTAASISGKVLTLTVGTILATDKYVKIAFGEQVIADIDGFYLVNSTHSPSGKISADNTPPVLANNGIVAKAGKTITVTFNEAIQLGSAGKSNGTGFSVLNNTVSTAATYDTVLTLTVNTALVEGQAINLTITANAIADTSGNDITTAIVKTATIIFNDAPTTVPTAPTDTVAQKSIKIFSDVADSNFQATVVGLNTNPNWGTNSGAVQETIASNTVLRMADLTFQGITFTVHDVSTMTKIHFDYYTKDNNNFEFSLISTKSTGGSQEAAKKIAPTTGSWQSVIIDISHFTDLNAKIDTKKIDQLKFVTIGQPNTTNTLYIDNIYFENDTGPDNTPPSIVNNDTMENPGNTITIAFNEYIAFGSAGNTSGMGFSVKNNTVTAVTISGKILTITVSTAFIAGETVELTIAADAIADTAGNSIKTAITNTTQIRDNSGTSVAPAIGAAHATFTNYTLVKQYEFNDTIKSSNWNYDTNANSDANSAGWGNGEIQYYTGAGEGNAYIKDNSLVIEAKAESKGTKSFTSARLHTHGLFAMRYGIIEARMMLPQSQSGQTDVATWPALWMLGKNFNGWGHDSYGGNMEWPSAGEIDIMESNQKQHGYSKTLATLHWNKNTTDDPFSSANRTYMGGEIAISNATSQYHTYALKWSSTALEFYLDGVKFHTHTLDTAGEEEEFRREFFLLVNLAVGGPGTDFTGNQEAVASKYSQFMYVDWIRVYQDLTDASSTISTN